MTQFMEQPQAYSGCKFDELMGLEAAPRDEPKYQRAEASYKCHDARYTMPQRSYDRQYAQLYFARLSLMSPIMKERAAAQWPGVPLAKILEVGDLPEDHEVVAVGTLFKNMKLKPTIMDEYTKDRGMRAALDSTNFCCDSDTLILEDEGGRMALRGACLPVHELVTGVIVAVKGKAEPGGDFIVDEWCQIGLAPQPPMPEPAAEDKYLALVSGLGLGKPDVDLLKVQMVTDFLAGSLGSAHEQQLASRVVRLVVAGGTVGQLEVLAAANGHCKQQSSGLQPVKDMDQVVMELASALPVDVMPGAEDPTNVALPQQPLHKCLFPSASSYGSLLRVTNPHSFELDGVHFLGTSGQSIDDLAKYSRHSDRLAMMELCLQWRHLAPTAPDTLTCFPYHDQDPFIIESSPHVFFVGNQPEFKVGSVQGSEGQNVRVVMVPSFNLSATVVLVNLRTLDCHPVSFQG